VSSRSAAPILFSRFLSRRRCECSSPIHGPAVLKVPERVITFRVVWEDDKVSTRAVPTHPGRDCHRSPAASLHGWDCCPAESITDEHHLLHTTGCLPCQHWLPCPVLVGPRTVQGRSPSPPLGQPLHPQVPRIRADLQERPHRSPHGWRQGWLGL
jgi:hypothetical protein